MVEKKRAQGRNQSNQQPQSGPARMNLMMTVTEEKYRPGAPVPCIQTPVYQQTSLQNQYCGVFHGAPVKSVAETTQKLFTTMTSTQTPQLQSSGFQYYCKENCCMPPLSVRFSQEDPFRFQPSGTQNLPSSAVSCPQTPQPLPRRLQHDTETLDCLQKNRTSDDMTASQLCNTSSSLPQGVANISVGSAGASAQSNLKRAKGNLEKKELRLMKNRDSARKYRNRRKDYMDQLQTRIILLENENEMLKAELECLRPYYLYLSQRPSQSPT
ncbi:cyclic AMP-dependent transcription factor ATF-1 isoform X3 [Etheostoma spectabile]|uniref:cyclic AMP-dependent transcription factor ATF-1 isoform X3 n=1 Tax=Etheostoma spectabile TaxID=54343 RepID=UPI0013AED91F|nr:cyclic AMP-dependent transcription factor ATF-1-like isoform X3 [Etheostoma spectabile]